MTTKVKVLTLGNSYNMHKMFEIAMTCLTHQMTDQALDPSTFVYWHQILFIENVDIALDFSARPLCQQLEVLRSYLQIHISWCLQPIERPHTCHISTMARRVDGIVICFIDKGKLLWEYQNSHCHIRTLKCSHFIQKVPVDRIFRN